MRLVDCSVPTVGTATSSAATELLGTMARYLFVILVIPLPKVLIVALIVYLDTKLSWAFSAFYEITSRNPQSCSFAGNATVNSAAPSSSAAAEQAASSCMAAAPSGTFVPSAATTLSQVSQTASPTGGSKSGGAATANIHGYLGAALVVAISVCLGAAML